MASNKDTDFRAAALIAVCSAGAAALLCVLLPALHMNFLSSGIGPGSVLVTDLVSGAVYYLQFDPLARLFENWGGTVGVLSYYAAVYSFGAALLLGARAGLAAILTTVSLLFVGSDLALWSTMAWFPLLLATVNGQGREKTLALTLLSLLISLASPSIGIFLGLTALISKRFLTGENATLKESLPILLPALLLVIIAPNPQFGVYPIFARTFPGFSQLAGLDPLVGPAPSMRILDRDYLEQAFYLVIAFSALALLLELVFFNSRKRSVKDQVPGVVALVFVTALFLDSGAVSEKVQIIGPLYSISRMIPSLVLYPLAPWAGALALFYLALFVSHGHWSRARISAHISLLLVLVAMQSVKLEAFGELIRPIDLDYLSSREEQHWLARVIHSPSYPLLKSMGPSALLNARKQGELRFRSLSNFKPELSASDHPDRLYVLSDDDRERRWSPAKGHQDGTEWIRFSFGRERKLQGIRILSNPYHSDFPRGVEIQAGKDCENLESVYRNPKWEGAISFTEDGLPYLRPQSEVELRFSPVPMQCLVVKQIGTDSNYDWSVTGVEVSFAE